MAPGPPEQKSTVPEEPVEETEEHASADAEEGGAKTAGAKDASSEVHEGEVGNKDGANEFEGRIDTEESNGKSAIVASAGKMSEDGANAEVVATV